MMMGQRLNQEKTLIFFSHNTSQERKDEIMRLSGIRATQRYDKYLGFPTLIGKSRTQAFKSIKDRVGGDSVIGSSNSCRKQAKRFF
jgi:hypothetical protein